MAWKSTYKVRENKAQPTLAILWMTVKGAIALHKWLVSCLHSETMTVTQGSIWFPRWYVSEGFKWTGKAAVR